MGIHLMLPGKGELSDFLRPAESQNACVDRLKAVRNLWVRRRHLPTSQVCQNARHAEPVRDVEDIRHVGKHDDVGIQHDRAFKP